MSRRDALRFHTDRAFRELDCARRASCDEAALSHLALSELHLRRMRDLREAPTASLRLVPTSAEQKSPPDREIRTA